MELTGREMGFSSHEVKKLYQNIKRGDNTNKNVRKCDMSGCRGGFRVDSTTGITEECPKCKGYGIIRSI